MTQAPPATPKPEVRFRDAMPKPLLASFLLLGLLGLATAVVLLVRPPRPSTLPLGVRRSPPKGTFTHDVGKIVPAPVATPVPLTRPACASFSRLVIDGGDPAQARLGAALESLCALTGPSIPRELAQALSGLNGATLRFAAFARSGEEATTDLARKVLYVNVRFARSNSPTILVTPILVHEGWHLAHADEPVTAEQEFFARTAELEACRELIDRDKWIRNCDDAERIVGMGEQRAVALLEAAGFPA